MEQVQTMQKRLRVNGSWMESSAATVVELLQWLGIDPSRRGIAVAVNDAVVLRSEWATAPLHDGDRVEILRATQGG
jgi:sulfur carrier protein